MWKIKIYFVATEFNEFQTKDEYLEFIICYSFNVISISVTLFVSLDVNTIDHSISKSKIA